MFTGKNILVVDDEPDLRDILKDEFEFCGAQVQIAQNGKEALEKVKANSFDVVLSDIRMPGGDGVTLAKEIKALFAEKPIVMLITGFADITPDHAYDLGVDGFFTKPFNLEVITRSVANALMGNDQKWAKSYEGSVPTKVLEGMGSSADLIAKGCLKIGRGGFYLKGEVPQLRHQDIVKFDFGDQMKGIGQVKWIRAEPNGEPAGMGVEIQNLEAASLQMVLNEIKKTKPKAYIPKS